MSEKWRKGIEKAENFEKVPKQLEMPYWSETIDVIRATYKEIEAAALEQRRQNFLKIKYGKQWKQMKSS